MNALASLIEAPGPAERSAFAKLTAEAATPPAAVQFTNEQLELIAYALQCAETDCEQRSAWFTKQADKAPLNSSRRVTALRQAHLQFERACEARDLSETISTALRVAKFGPRCIP